MAEDYGVKKTQADGFVERVIEDCDAPALLPVTFHEGQILCLRTSEFDLSLRHSDPPCNDEPLVALAMQVDGVGLYHPLYESDLDDFENAVRLARDALRKVKESQGG